MPLFLIFVIGTTCIMPLGLIYLTGYIWETFTTHKLTDKKPLFILTVGLIVVLSVFELHRYLGSVNTDWQEYLSAMILMTMPFVFLIVNLWLVDFATSGRDKHKRKEKPKL